MNENNGADNGKSYHNDNGKFAVGNPGKPKGSSKNKLRDEIKNFLDDQWQHFPTWFSKLKEKEKIQAMLDLLPYGLSRLQSISMTDSDGNDLPNQGMDLSRWAEQDLRLLISLQEKYHGNGN